MPKLRLRKDIWTGKQQPTPSVADFAGLGVSVGPKAIPLTAPQTYNRDALKWAFEKMGWTSDKDQKLLFDLWKNALGHGAAEWKGQGLKEHMADATPLDWLVSNLSKIMMLGE